MLSHFRIIEFKTIFLSRIFNSSAIGAHSYKAKALSLYKWAPIAEELKTLDRKIVLNSMILKWDIIRDEFKKLIEF